MNEEPQLAVRRLQGAPALEGARQRDLVNIFEVAADGQAPGQSRHAHAERRKASFEIAGSHAGPNEDINYFVALVDGLSPEARALWDGCYSRVFDLGYRSGSGTPSYRSELRPNTIHALAKLNATIVVTIYPLSSDDT